MWWGNPGGNKLETELFSTTEVTESTDLRKVGVNKFNPNRFDTLVNIFHHFTDGETEETKKIVTRWIITQCFINDINYVECLRLIYELDGDEEYVTNIYKDFESYRVIGSFEKEVMRTISVTQKKPREYYTRTRQELGDCIIYSQSAISPEINIKDNAKIRIDIDKRVVNQIQFKQFKQKSTEKSVETIIAAAPLRVVEYNQTPKLFRWTFEDELGYMFTTEAQSLKDTCNQLKEEGYVLQTKNLTGTLSACLRAMKFAGKPYYQKRSKFLPMGFHYQDGEILVEGYDLEDPTDEEIIEAIDILEEYRTWFTDDEQEFLATTFKWGLFAPFSYAYKTKNHTRFVRWLYLHGEGRVGKSNGYGKFVSHLWFDEPLPNFEKYYESFRTVPRFRDIISKNTFPILMNETQRALEESKDLKDMYKTCVEGTVITNTLGDKGNTYHAYSPAICTSNGYINDESGAIEGRTLQMTFSHKMREEKHGKDIAFDKEWQIGNAHSKLNKLRAISHKVAKEIVTHPDYITWDWVTLIDTLLSEIYESVDKELPDWLKLWVSNESAYQQQVIETKQGFYEALQKVINRERNPMDTESNPIFYVEPILKARKIVGLYMKNDGYVYITQSLLDSLYKRGDIELKQKLSQFADSYGWINENKTVYLDPNFRAKAVKKEYETFINEVYDLDFGQQN